MREKISALKKPAVLLIIILIIVAGCLPDKKGGFSCIAAPLLGKIKLPIGQQTVQQSQPLQPKDIKAEEAKINKLLDQLCTALTAKDIEGSLTYFHEGEKEKYRKVLSAYVDRLPEMAADLKKAKISSLSFETASHNRTAEYLVPAGSHSVPIRFIYVDGQWLIKVF